MSPNTNKFVRLFTKQYYLRFIEEEVINRLQLNWVELYCECVCVCLRFFYFIGSVTLCYDRSLEHGTAVYTALFPILTITLLYLELREKNLCESSSLCNYLTIFWAQVCRSYYRYRRV